MKITAPIRWSIGALFVVPVAIFAIGYVTVWVPYWRLALHYVEHFLGLR